MFLSLGQVNGSEKVLLPCVWEHHLELRPGVLQNDKGILRWFEKKEILSSVQKLLGKPGSVAQVCQVRREFWAIDFPLEHVAYREPHGTPANSRTGKDRAPG